MPKPAGSVGIGGTWSPGCPLLQSWWLQRRDPTTRGESPGTKGCLSMAVGPSLWQMVRGHTTYVPCAPTAPLISGPLALPELGNGEVCWCCCGHGDA